MKIHGTAKGGALDNKDFGVAFGGGGAAAPTYDDGLGDVADCSLSGGFSLSESVYKLGTGSVNFDGVNAYGSADGLATTSAKNAIKSISFWINPTIVANKYIMVFADTDASPDNSYLRIGWWGSGGALDIVMLSDGTSKWHVDTGTGHGISDDNWAHVVITHNDTTPNFYINGVDVTSSVTWHNDTVKAFWLNDDSTIDNLRIAVCNCYGSGNQGYGTFYLDECTYYNTALPLGTDADTENSVKWLYNDGTGRLASTMTTGLLSYWNCDSVDDDKLVNQAIPP